jgi:hydrogenase nickel incorporation protein HypA/HybF
MHEYPVTERIIKIAVETAINNKAHQITGINLVIGDLSGFIGESIQMYFDILSKGTLAEKAKINIKTVQTRFKCEKCGQMFEISNRDYQCPKCGGDGLPTETGKEFYIESIEVDS